MVAIELIDVSFAFQGNTVLEGINLRFERGERTALIGANGVGKTTLLRIMSGVLPPGSGVVRLDNRPLTTVPKRELARTIAVVPQEFSVPFAFTARELVELGRTPHLGFWSGLRREDRDIINHALQMTDTASFADKTANELSGGERQRLMIAMALAQQPKILLLDEPTQQLDITRQAEILDLIAEVNIGKHLTVIAAIHDLNLAARYFERLVVLQRGSILADGPPSAVLSAELLRQAYNGAVEVSISPADHLPVVLPIPRSATGGKA